ncbi:MAG: response regulator transcription factor [Magnetococcales bacterium]|nr:response regulator transcription factor [Magnetococcales bacterium]
MPPLVLIVEDEADLAASLEYGLKQAGFACKIAPTGQAALEACCDKPVPDFVLLDLMLPDISGIDLCHQLRRYGQTRHLPILMLTARGEEPDRVLGLESGADDYMAKPFSMRELVLRIKAILRRPAQQMVPGQDKWQAGPLTLFPVTQEVRFQDRKLTLTPLEFRLLESLIQAGGACLNRTQLLSAVWGGQLDHHPRTVDAHINRLREKMGMAGILVETVRGLGYRFRLPPTP